jgi:hypothetical protein
MAYCPSHEADGKRHAPSMSICERDGKVLLCCRAGCAQRDVIAALRARGLWPDRERPTWTPAERHEWRRQQRELERDLPDARHWRRAAVLLGEAVLDKLKAALADPALPRPEIGELRAWTDRLAWWQRMGNAALVAEFRWRRQHHPQMTAGLVRAAKMRAEAWRQAILTYLTLTVAEARQ